MYAWRNLLRNLLINHWKIAGKIREEFVLVKPMHGVVFSRWIQGRESAFGRISGGKISGEIASWISGKNSEKVPGRILQVKSNSFRHTWNLPIFEFSYKVCLKRINELKVSTGSKIGALPFKLPEEFLEKLFDESQWRFYLCNPWRNVEEFLQKLLVKSLEESLWRFSCRNPWSNPWEIPGGTSSSMCVGIAEGISVGLTELVKKSGSVSKLSHDLLWNL